MHRNSHEDLLSTLGPRRRALLWCAVLSGLLLSMLDQTIVGTALPTIVEDLGGHRWYVWVVSAYLVPATVMIPVFTRLSDRFGRQRMLLSGMATFVAASALCAFAQQMPQLVAARAVQGVGAAALEALSFLLVMELAGPTRSARAQLALAGVMTFSFVGGPLAGGILSDLLGWRSIFLVNVPLGMAALAVIAVVLPPQVGQREDRRLPVDVAGIAVLTLATGALLVGLHQHAVVSSWSDSRTGGMVVLGLMGLALLVLVERRAVAPVLPPRLLADPVVGRLLVAGGFATFGLYVLVVLLPRLLQSEQGLSASATGVRMYPFLLALLVGVNVGVGLIQSRGRYVVVLVGASAVVMAAAGGFRVWVGGDLYAHMAVLALLGLGMGPALSGLQMVIGRVVAPEDLGAAMGALLLARQVGGAVALAGGEALYDVRVAAGTSPMQATGLSVAVIAAGGAAVAGIALLGLRGRDVLAPRPPERDRPLTDRLAGQRPPASSTT